MCAMVCRTPRMQAVAGDIAERHQDYSVQAMTNFVWGATALGFFDEVPSWPYLQSCQHAVVKTRHCSALGLHCTHCMPRGCAHSFASPILDSREPKMSRPLGLLQRAVARLEGGPTTGPLSTVPPAMTGNAGGGGGRGVGAAAGLQPPGAVQPAGLVRPRPQPAPALPQPAPPQGWLSDDTWASIDQHRAASLPSV